MKDDYFKTLGMMICVMYTFGAFLSLSFVFDKHTPFLQTISPVLDFLNLSLGVAFVSVSLLFCVLYLRSKMKERKISTNKGKK